MNLPKNLVRLVSVSWFFNVKHLTVDSFRMVRMSGGEHFRVGVNGPGAIGELVARDIADDYYDNLELSGINHPSATEREIAYSLFTNTKHGLWRDHDVQIAEGTLVVDGNPITLHHASKPAEIPWHESSSQIIVEASGKFDDPDKARGHLQSGNPLRVNNPFQVILTSPAKGDCPTIVWGVNHGIYRPGVDTVVSASSCSTNCIVPFLHALQEFGINTVLGVTTHADTQSNPSQDEVRGLLKGRPVDNNIVPTSTGASSSLVSVLPHLRGATIDLRANRVDSYTSQFDLWLELSQNVSEADVVNKLREAAQGNLRGVMSLTDQPLTAIDVLGERAAVTIPLEEIHIVNGRFVRARLLYDNEVGYAAQVGKLASHIASLHS